MATLRDGLVRQVVARLATITGWSASMRAEEEATNVPVLAIVACAGESKRLVDSMHYECTLQVAVLIVARSEDASASLDGGNGYSYLDRLVGLAEATMHATPWPNDELITITGHSVDDPSNSNRLVAELNLQIIYRHNVKDPTQYAPVWTP